MQIVTALVRPSSLGKSNVLNLQKRGVNIASFDLGDSEDNIIASLRDTDVLILCCVIDEMALATAAKKADVKRYIPCFYAIPMPRGVQTLRNSVGYLALLIDRCSASFTRLTLLQSIKGSCTRSYPKATPSLHYYRCWLVVPDQSPSFTFRPP